MAIGQDDTSIVVTLSGEEFLPGDTIDVDVQLGGPGDEKLRAVRIELSYVNTYKHVQSGANGQSYESESSDTVVVDTKELSVEQAGLAIGSGAFETTVALPIEAPPSLPEYVEWSVKAVLDRRRAIDRDEERSIRSAGPRPWRCRAGAGRADRQGRL